MFERVTIDPNILHGEPCIRGMRIPVHLVISLVAAGMTTPQIISEGEIAGHVTVIEPGRIRRRVLPIRADD